MIGIFNFMYKPPKQKFGKRHTDTQTDYRNPRAHALNVKYTFKSMACFNCSQLLIEGGILHVISKLSSIVT